MISASPDRGRLSFLLKSPVLGLYSKARWMVLASFSVASLSRFAALPVGADKSTLLPHFSKTSTTAFTMVVFPVPGPPVMTNIFLSRLSLMASFC